MPVSKELIEILACPSCKGDVELNEKNQKILCKKCNLMFAIEDDVPNMILEEAKPINIEVEAN